jgi:putative FmdB family regulatory protein
MPTYAYKCKTPGCEDSFEKFLPLSRYDEEQECPSCMQPAVKQLLPFRVQADYAAYQCPVTGRSVDGRKAHAENLKRTGCRILETGEKEQVEKNKAAGDAQFERDLDHTVDKFIDQLPTDKKNRLVAEAEAGVTVNIERV